MSDEPTAADGRPVGKRAENGGPNRGFAGAVRKARKETPEDASAGQLEEAAILIWLKGFDAAEAWSEVVGGDA